MEILVNLIIQAVGGALGGNAIGATLKNMDLGTLGNSIAGVLGGGVGAALLKALGVFAQSPGTLDIGSILGSVASGGVGGAVLLIIVSLIKGTMARA